MPDYNRIPEDKIPLSSKSKDNELSLVFYLTEDEEKMLISLSKNNGVKEYATISKFVRTIIKNTYLYLNNKERGILSDITKAFNKPYYGDLDKRFKEKLEPGKKEYDLVIEILRIQILKANKDPFAEYKDIKSDKRISFRLNGEDLLDLRNIIYGNKYMSNPDFIQGFVRYFLSSSRLTQEYILSYPNLLKLERAIKDKRCIIINDKKYKPYKITNARHPIPSPVLLCFDENDIFTKVQLKYIIQAKSILETEVLFDFTAHETRVINAFNSLKTLTASFKIIDENEREAKDFKDNQILKSTLPINSFKEENGKTVIEFDYYIGSNVINKLDTAFKRGSINYLIYSDDYVNFLKLNNNHKI